MLSSLLMRLSERFPAEHALQLRPSAGPEAWAPLAERFPGGHAERWFAATDGQANSLPAYMAHAFGSLAEAADAMHICDEIRAEPEGYWVERQWLAIAADGAGQHLMIDDADGRVLMVAHDDDQVAVLAPTPEAWLQGLLEGLDDGSLTIDGTFGLIETEQLAQIHASRQERERRRAQPLPLKHKLGLGATIVGMIAFALLIIWFLETHR